MFDYAQRGQFGAYFALMENWCETVSMAVWGGGERSAKDYFGSKGGIGWGEVLVVPKNIMKFFNGP